MATDLSNFDAFEANFIDELREALDVLAGMGEQYIKGKHGNNSLHFGGGAHYGFGVDTGSLLASVTGYEAKIGDPFANFDDPDWQHAQAVGSDKYKYNTPEHYKEHVESRDLGEGENPVAVLTVFTQYPDPTRGKDAELEEAVKEAFSDAAQFMQNNLVGKIKDKMRWGGKSGISIRGN